MKKHFLFLAIFFLVACGKKVVPVSEKKQEIITTYSEDLSEFRDLLDAESEVEDRSISEKNNRPKQTTEPLYVNDKIEAVLVKRAEKNKGIKFANGFRIQVYVGRERKEVDDAKVFVYQNFPNLNPYLTYNLPIYKLKIGDFLTKTDAERILNQLKDNFPEAVILAEKIDVKKSFLKE